MTDISLTCKDCQREFKFSEREQDFFKEKGWSLPIRCRDCRRRRKAEKGGFKEAK